MRDCNSSRHTAHIRTVHRISDRVLAIDLDYEKISICMIAAYAPRAGFVVSDFDLFIGQLSLLVTNAQSAGRRVILGGEFNCQSQSGTRGRRLQEHADEYGLSCINDWNPSRLDTNYTFESSQGIRRVINLLFVSRSFGDSKATVDDSIHLASDHRCIHGRILWNRQHAPRRRRKNARGMEAHERHRWISSFLS